MIDFNLLFDPLAGALVLGGTGLATLALCGPRDVRDASREVVTLTRQPFDETGTRAQLAANVELMRHDGVIRTEPARPADAEFADATAALVRYRSVQAMQAEHGRHRALREKARARAVRVLDQSGELAPVFGLAGTLLALSQLPGGGVDSVGDLMLAVSTAVVSTLYGLLLAHLLLAPLARAIERRGEREDDARGRLAAWLANQLADACPSPRPAPPEPETRRAA